MWVEHVFQKLVGSDHNHAVGHVGGKSDRKAPVEPRDSAIVLEGGVEGVPEPPVVAQLQALLGCVERRHDHIVGQRGCRARRTAPRR
eukprot:scaffold30483_cov52-Attheya_sp.AAC.7